jgi:hypothetical protein
MKKIEINRGLCKAKHDTTAACRQGIVEQENIKAFVDTVFYLTQKIPGHSNVLDIVI